MLKPSKSISPLKCHSAHGDPAYMAICIMHNNENIYCTQKYQNIENIEDIENIYKTQPYIVAKKKVESTFSLNIFRTV